MLDASSYSLEQERNGHHRRVVSIGLVGQRLVFLGSLGGENRTLCRLGFG